MYREKDAIFVHIIVWRPYFFEYDFEKTIHAELYGRMLNAVKNMMWMAFRFNRMVQ